MAFTSPSEICRLRKLAADVMFNLGVLCGQIDELEQAALTKDATRHNEALISADEIVITLPCNVEAFETALPQEIKS